MLLGTILSQSPSDPHVGQAVQGFESIDLAEEWPFGNREDLQRIAAILKQESPFSLRQIDREFHRLFVGPQKLQAPPWGSTYLDSEGVVFGDSCLKLTRWMTKNGIALHEDTSREPADQIGRMFILLGWLCGNDPDLIDEFLRDHLLTWSPKYFESLDKAASDAPFYRAVGQLASLTLDSICALSGI